jgi:hypothetical protein
MSFLLRGPAASQPQQLPADKGLKILNQLLHATPLTSGLARFSERYHDYCLSWVNIEREYGNRKGYR